MYVIDVIPLSRTAPGVLSYRSSKDLSIGSIVSITIRKTETQGIVVSSTHVKDAKEMLKHARFLLSRSIPSASGSLPEEVLRAAEKTALYHATTIGAVLAAMFSEHIRLGVPLPTHLSRSGTGHVVEICELPLVERAKKYEERIDRCIANKTSVLLISPTLPELAFWNKTFRAYKPLVLSGAVSSAKRSKTLEAARDHMGLIIATPSFSWIPIEKLGCAIIDRASSGTYTQPKRPYLSLPYALTALMEQRNIPIMIGDFPLPLEYRSSDALSRGTLSPLHLIDARRPKDAEPDSKPWASLPDIVFDAIRNEMEQGGRVIILAARRGYAPAVVCRDCGQSQTDGRGMPLSFSVTNDRIFQTSDGMTYPAKSRVCQRCESWNLLPLGVGIERVEEEVRARFPEAAILLATTEVLTSPRKARALVDDAQRPGSMVIGTEALLPWIYAYAGPAIGQPLGIIASADSLLSLPFWRARERFVRLSYFLRGLVRETFLITRHPEDTAVDAAVHPESSAFWEEERALRKALQYPPYGTLITLAVEGSAKRVENEVQDLAAQLTAYSPVVIPQRAVHGAMVRGVLVLHLPHDVWPDESLSRQLSTLPPNVRVRIDPESIW